MHFEWSETQTQLYQEILAFAGGELNHGVVERDLEHRFDRAAWDACGNFGLLALSVPAEYGGLGLDALSTAHMMEAFGRGCEDGGLVFAASAHLFACTMPIVDFAERELAARFVPELASGRSIGANAITEAEAGSDVFALKSSARRDGDHYVLDGVKTYVSNGPTADLILFYASTNPDHGHLGISAFVVESDRPGLSLGEAFVKQSLTTAPICPIYFDGVRIPLAQRLGQEGQGSEIFTHSMRWERTCLFAGYLGAMDRQLEQTVAYAKERRQFRKPISRNQAVAHRIADMKLRLDSARLLLYRACWTLANGGKADLEISLAKLSISEAAIQSSLDAIQIHGGAGIMSEIGIERGLRDALPSTIFSGTSEIQRQIVARELGL